MLIFLLLHLPFTIPTTPSTITTITSTITSTPIPSHCKLSSTTLSPSTSIPTDCQRIEGRLRVDGTSRLSDSQLSQLFANVREIVGVVQIWNSELQTANFLGNLRRISGDLLEKSLSVWNNTQLTSLNLSSLELADGKVDIQNNPLLELKSSCAHLHRAFFNRRSISSNECGCELPVKFHWPQVRDFPENCEVLYGDFRIEDVAPPIDVLYRLLSVKKLYGCLRVENSNLETLGFLQNLEEIEPTPRSPIITIQSNEYLRRLDLLNLKFLGTSDQLTIRGEFLCIDPELAQLIMHSDIKWIEMSVQFCPLNRINNPSIYCTGKLSAIGENCTRYIGSISYWNMDTKFIFYEDYDVVDKTKVPEADIRRFQQFEYIFGEIYIQGSALHNITLPNLIEIYAPSTPYAITISYNSLLTKIEMPKLRMVYEMVQFIRNKKLVMNEQFCGKLTKNLKRGRVAKGEEVWFE